MKKDLHDVRCLTAPEPTPLQIVQFRASLRMTQKEFAEEFDIPLGTLRRWEQGVSTPRASGSFLRLFSAMLKLRSRRNSSPSSQHQHGHFMLL